MAKLIIHRNIKIFVLAPGEQIARHTTPDAIALQEEKDGWWVRFIDSDGHVTSYDEAYPAYEQALWAAKAAAEFGLD